MTFRVRVVETMTDYDRTLDLDASDWYGDHLDYDELEDFLDSLTVGRVVHMDEGDRIVIECVRREDGWSGNRKPAGRPAARNMIAKNSSGKVRR